MKNRINLLDMHQKLKRPLILDGAMGSLLLEKGINNHLLLWTALSNIEKPDIVKSLHIEYINAGADIITTNTFRTNPYVIKKSNINISTSEFVKIAVSIAKSAHNSKEVIIAGSNAPAEDCYQKERTISYEELIYNHSTHINELWENSVDVIWNETQSHKDEIEIICNICHQHKLPYIISLYFDDNLKILSGENLYEIVDFIKPFEPLAVGFNCIKPMTFFNYIEKYTLPEKWGFYFNCGAGDYQDDFIICGISPEKYINIIKPLLDLKPLFIGTCCGSNPFHTKAIKELLNETYRN